MTKAEGVTSGDVAGATEIEIEAAVPGVETGTDLGAAVQATLGEALPGSVIDPAVQTSPAAPIPAASLGDAAPLGTEPATPIAADIPASQPSDADAFPTGPHEATLQEVGLEGAGPQSGVQEGGPQVSEQPAPEGFDAEIPNGEAREVEAHEGDPGEDQAPLAVDATVVDASQPPIAHEQATPAGPGMTLAGFAGDKTHPGALPETAVAIGQVDAAGAKGVAALQDRIPGDRAALPGQNARADASNAARGDTLASEAGTGAPPAFKLDQSVAATPEAGPSPSNPAISGPASSGPSSAAQPSPNAPIRVVSEVPLGAVPVEIGLKSLAGINHFEIRLDPVELGRIEVRLEIDQEGGVKAYLSVDRVETLALLQRDARTLERAFDQAGLKLSEGSIDLSLRDQQAQGQGRDQGGDQRREGSRHSDPDRRRDDAHQALVEPPRRVWRGAAGVDVRI